VLQRGMRRRSEEWKGWVCEEGEKGREGLGSLVRLGCLG